MNRPAIQRTCRRIRVPELYLENLSTRVVEAAEIFDGSRIVAAQWRERTERWETGETGPSQREAGGDDRGDTET